MEATIAKTWHFDAAHVLPNHDGKCARPHGHTYSLTVAVTGPVQPTDGRPQEGMVMDFGVLAEAWDKIEPMLDHRDLNESLQTYVAVTTSEHLAMYLYRLFATYLPDGVRMESCRIAETASTYAEVRA